MTNAFSQKYIFQNPTGLFLRSMNAVQIKIKSQPDLDLFKMKKRKKNQSNVVTPPSLVKKAGIYF